MGIRVVVVLAALWAVSPVAAQSRATPPPLLVSTAWLADHLLDPDLVILQTSQTAPSPEQIAGARLVPHDSLMTMDAGHDLADTSTLVTIMERAGVSNVSHVVVYGDPLAAGWLFFVLDYLGHERVSILDGGLEQWKGEGRSVTAAGAAARRGQFTPHLRPQLKASAESIQGRSENTVVVLDARSDREYVAGHIPGARLLTWQNVYADADRRVFKSPTEIAALFAAAGASSGKAVVTYCQIGLRSSLLYFAARYAGLDASNYVGSWGEWSAKGLPTEPGR